MDRQVKRRAAAGLSGDRVVIEAAWLYYREGRNQNEIAARLAVSRATVVNYLQDARERGFVRISLAPEAFTGHDLAQRLRERFGLAEAFVTPDGETEDISLARAAQGAADWLPTLLAPGDRLGVAWGRTVFEMAEAMEPVRMEDVAVLQLVGSMATPYGFTAEYCSTIIAERLGARCVNLHAPAILASADLAERLKAEPIIAAQLDAIGACRKAVFAAGSATPESHVVSSGVATPEELDAYRAAGAVGVLCGRFIDAEGRPAPGPLNARILGVELERLRGLDLGLLVSSGPDKVEPMRAAIRGGYVTHLVTSESTAEALLAGGGGGADGRT